MSSVSMTITLGPASTATGQSRRVRSWRWSRALLGLVLLVGVALLWELAVRAGWANGRLVPPPSVIWNMLVELAQSG